MLGQRPYLPLLLALLGGACLLSLDAAPAAALELRASPAGAGWVRYLDSRVAFLADGSAAAIGKDQLVFFDPAGKVTARIRKIVPISLIPLKDQLLVVTGDALRFHDAAGGETARIAGLKNPTPFLVDGRLVAYLERAAAHGTAGRLSLLDDKRKVREHFSVPGGYFRFELLDAEKGAGVLMARMGDSVEAPHRIALWEKGKVIKTLDAGGQAQRMAAFPNPYKGPVFVLRGDGKQIRLLAFDLKGKALWSKPIGEGNMRSWAGRISSSGEHIAVWGYVGDAEQGETDLSLFTRAGRQKAKLRAPYIREVAFAPSTEKVVITAPDVIRCIDAAAGRQLWQHKANTDIRVSPGLFFVDSKAGLCVGYMCITLVPTGKDLTAGRSSVVLRNLSTGKVLARKQLKGIDYRIRVLPRGRILLRHGRKTSLLELR